MKIQSVNSSNTNFEGRLRLNNLCKWNQGIADAILAEEKLQKLACASDKDIILYQSTKIARRTKGMHCRGERLYRISIAKEENNSFLNRALRFFGFNKINLSRGHHSQFTVVTDIIPNINIKKLKSKFNIQ